MTPRPIPVRLAALLAALAAIGPFAVDTYLPAFPQIRAELGATPLEVQQTLTVFMAMLALMVLWHGALADRFGRRRVLLAATAVFALASLLCALAPTIEWLWAGRALQGMSGGAGMVVGRAVIRDLHDGAQAQRLMARVMMIFGLAPAVAPLLGAALLALAGWRAIFLFLAAFGAGLAWLTWRYLPETLDPGARQALHPASLLRGYASVLGHPAFLLLAVVSAVNFNGFFIYLMSAPVFVLEHLQLSETGFAWLFVPSVGGMMIGSALSERVAGRWSPRRTIGAGFAVMVGAAVLNLGVSVLLPAGVPQSVLPVGLFTLGLAMVSPSLSLLALDLFPARRGLASSCQAFLQLGLNAFTAGVLAPLLWGSTVSLAVGMGLFVAFGLLAFALWLRGGFPPRR